MNPVNKPRFTLSVWLVSGIALVALLAGWIVKTGEEGKVQAVAFRNVTAMVPGGWKVMPGLTSSEMVFTARNVFSPSNAYIVSLVPASAEMMNKDIALSNNINRADFYDTYRVLDQADEFVSGKPAYTVHYAYVDAKDTTEAPRVIEGKDYIFMGTPNALVITVEEESAKFEDAKERFLKFLDTVVYIPGGKQ